MREELLLKASSVHLAAGDAGAAVDSAVWAYAVAPDEEGRAVAAVAAARGMIDLDEPADAISWSEWALTAVPGHRAALTCRGLGHRALGRLDLALADLDAAVAVRTEDQAANGEPASVDIASGAYRPVPDSRSYRAVFDTGMYRALADTGMFRAVTDAGPHRAGFDTGSYRALTDTGSRLVLAETSLRAPARARFARALVLAETGRRAEAYQELGYAAADPDTGQLAFRVRGGWRMVDGDLAGAVADLTAAARLGDRRALGRLLEVTDELPDDPEIRLTRLVALRVAEQGEQAAELADALLARGDLAPALRAKVLLNRGYVARLGGGWAAAAGWLEQAAELAPDDAATLTAYGRVLSRADRGDEAVEVLLRAVALEPGDGRPEMFLGDLHTHAGRPEAAAEWYERALGIVPCDRAARFGLARAQVALGQVTEGTRLAQFAAIAGYPAAVDWCRGRDVPLPGDRMAEVTGAASSGAGHNPFTAERVLLDAAELWLSHSVGAGDLASRRAATALWHAARYELEMGEPAAAEATLERALELRPAFAAAWGALGDARVALGRPREALLVYERCAWWDPRDADAPAGRAEALIRLGRGEEALAALDVAIATGYLEDPARVQRLYRRRARLHQALGQWDAAAADFTHLLGGGGYDSDEIEEWRRGVLAVSACVAAGPDGYPPQEYRSYGLARDDWDGYGGMDWSWRLEFVEEPGPEARVRLATALGRCLRAATAGQEGSGIGVTVHWSGPFALLRVSAEEGDALAALRGPLVFAVEALHRVCPLVEVVNLAAQGVALDEDPAEAWSVAIRPVPDPGPLFGVPAGFWVPAPAEAGTFPEPAPDPEADVAFRAALTGPDPVSEIKLVMIDPDAVPGPPAPPAPRDLGPLRRYPHDYGRFADDGAGVVVRRPGEFHTGLDRVTSAGEVYQVVAEGPPNAPMTRQIEGVSVAPDGGFAMFATALGRDLYLLDLASGATAVLMEGVPRVETTAFLDGGLIVVKTIEWLAVFALTPDGPALIARDFTATGPAVVCAGGRIIIAGGVREPELVVYGFAEGALGRLAELSGPVNCYRVWASGDRAFAADRSVFELVGLLPAWERFAAWAATVPATMEAGGAAGGIVVEELDDAPYTGIGDGLDAIRDVAFWCVKGPAGMLLAVQETGAGHELLVGDETGVRPTVPPLRESGFEYDWRPDGRALLIRGHDSTTVCEVDVVRGTVTTVGYSAGQACYTTTGFAVLRPDELALYGWQHGSEAEPVELGRYPVAPGAATLGWADGGRVLHLTAGGLTGFYVVGGGALYPMGAFPAEDWFSGWNHGGALYFANRHSGRDFRAYRVTGFGPAVVEALGRPAVARLEPAELPQVRRIDRPVYPDTTHWRYFSDE